MIPVNDNGSEGKIRDGHQNQVTRASRFQIWFLLRIRIHVFKKYIADFGSNVNIRVILQ